ncbi:phenylalanine--tRNA ligase subunit beta [Candidatus Gottesmanbacteria bacterium RIFCSPLOWO2_01_FULL_49_10]|uniref:phenylalanine--tRNA ligase n=1 Tax=Candidatus Gottesmanbacteria bacterium RIFCSPLOWO2_01_FULL_49_10 TaxID=1798396 RepID=A0A1F6AXS1_9BACT|nr:MAG: phenylalanine--tRNA ligase subunit beta [Candidatus Gottesmanbacteria bacterium RIFCSPLOWO2_01_FULL_49_10]
MNILIPDSWLREYLNTKATPKQIKEYLSLCGPSVERIHKEAVEVIYDVEITTNRPDAMSVVGVAREAAAILPRFGIAAKLLHDPYKIARKQRWQDSKIANKTLTIKTDANLNPRWTSIVFEGVTVKPSPNWLKKKLEATGIRSLNNIIDITNYLMRGLGQPAHAFDFDAISDKANHATMILRASKKGEKLTTLDGKNHTLPGDDIVIEDGKGRLIDLCGVMGAQNSAIRASTKTVILFLQTYDPMHIRRTMMNLAHRTEAGGLFEKGTDPELVLSAFAKGVELVTELSGGSIASRLYDIYPKPHKPYTVSLTRTKADAYIGKHLSDKEIMEILNTLGFQTKVTKEVITVSVPSFRRDVTIDVDIIEELARIYGYHNITSTLPDTAPPVVMPDPALGGEEEIKMRLRDWGYTETYTYSMISEDLMDIFGLDKAKVYKIANPLSNEWVYMRPTLWPSMLSSVKQNLNIKPDLTLFELSMTYIYRAGKLPDEKPVLLIAWTGDQFYNAKGIGEAIFALFGIPLAASHPVQMDWYTEKQLQLGAYGSVGLVHQKFLDALQIHTPVTILELDIEGLIAHARSTKQYIPIPKYPPSFEDLAFVLPPQTPVGPMMAALKSAHPLVTDVTLLDKYETTTTFHITYLSPEKNLTTEDLRPAREKLIALAQQKFGTTLKTI